LRHKKERTIEKANKIDKCREKKYTEQVYLFFLSLYPRKKLAIASGATLIRSAGRAPDDIYSCILEQRRQKKIQEASLLPLGGKFLLV
jgi:hypothetical protein